MSHGFHYNKKKLEYTWLRGFGRIERNDIIVFNFPLYKFLDDSCSFLYGAPTIKRCYGLAGDSIYIEKIKDKNVEQYVNASQLFPSDSTLHWKINS